MSTTQERVEGTVDGQRDAVRAILDRQRHAFAAEGPPSVAVRRNRIDRLLALANFDRVVGLIDDARANGASVETVAPDGESLPDPVSRKVAPTIVRDVDERMRIANEEIFGPVLVVRPYSQLTDAVDYINQRPAPLVAYWYGPDNDDFRSFVRNTRSGGVARNDFAAHMIPSAAPFGGVGRSGMGAYHGKAGFDAFSHYRAVVGSDLPLPSLDSRRPRSAVRCGSTRALGLRMARNRTRRRLKCRR